jgi:hemolysin-activating ACP:hemolysin acyltransferase
MIHDVLKLMMESEMHRKWYIEDLKRLVIPALENKKMLVMYDETRPAGLFSYAFLPKEAEQGYLDGTQKLQSEIWSNGPKDGSLYVIDFIAPYQNALALGRFAQKRLTERYIETYPFDGAHFIRQMKGKRVGYATGVQSELDMRRYCCAV